MHKNVLALPMSVTGAYTKDEPIFNGEITY